MPFIVMARYYLPAALPLTLLAVLWLGRIPRKLSLAVTLLALGMGRGLLRSSGAVLPGGAAAQPI